MILNKEKFEDYVKKLSNRGFKFIARKDGKFFLSKDFKDREGMIIYLMHKNDSDKYHVGVAGYDKRLKWKECNSLYDDIINKAV